ncbi:hypothetical protein RA263_30050, partial [Pseudomonas syringae pv. tagetis]|uniref:hypothetical protein n=1 Tax=Pseudomonas syringae group genomosp. 7 TaxID=251699 RepID=UPI00377056E0
MIPVFLLHLRQKLTLLSVAILLLITLVCLADRLWPLALPKADLARVVLAVDGTPLWRFADGNGVCRYPVSNEQV